MSADRGGIFDASPGLVRRGLGGRSGNGRQYVSWLHEDDFVAAGRRLIARDGLGGTVNLAAPQLPTLSPASPSRPAAIRGGRYRFPADVGRSGE